MKNKSPFFVVPDFISPLLCEDLVDMCDFVEPDMTVEGKPAMTIRKPEQAQQIIFDRLLAIIPKLEQHYGVKYKGTEPISIEWFPTGSEGQLGSENSEFLRGKWVQVRARTLTCVLFLSDYQDTPPFDQEFEGYGGKLEFPQHQFGFNPKRGTLVVFPSAPHFINKTTNVVAGNLYQAKVQIATSSQFLYNPSEFPGNYTTWFNP